MYAILLADDKTNLFTFLAVIPPPLILFDMLASLTQRRRDELRYTTSASIIVRSLRKTYFKKEMLFLYTVLSMCS